VRTDKTSNQEINRLPSDFQQITHEANVAARDVTESFKDAYRELSSKVEEGVERTRNYARSAVDGTRDAAERATGTAKDLYESAAMKAGDTVANSRECMGRNPVSFILGSFVIGAAAGYILACNRRKSSLSDSERYGNEPLFALQEQMLTALSPVAKLIHERFASARDGVGKAIKKVNRSKFENAAKPPQDRS
jgi:gas vesicle protein